MDKFGSEARALCPCLRKDPSFAVNESCLRHFSFHLPQELPPCDLGLKGSRKKGLKGFREGLEHSLLFLLKLFYFSHGSLAMPTMPTPRQAPGGRGTHTTLYPRLPPC